MTGAARQKRHRDARKAAGIVVVSIPMLQESSRLLDALAVEWGCTKQAAADKAFRMAAGAVLEAKKKGDG